MLVAVHPLTFSSVSKSIHYILEKHLLHSVSFPPGTADPIRSNFPKTLLKTKTLSYVGKRHFLQRMNEVIMTLEHPMTLSCNSGKHTCSYVIKAILHDLFLISSCESETSMTQDSHFRL